MLSSRRNSWLIFQGTRAHGCQSSRSLWAALSGTAQGALLAQELDWSIPVHPFQHRIFHGSDLVGGDKAQGVAGLVLR